MSTKAPALVLVVTAAVALGGCARSAEAPGGSPSSGISLPDTVTSTGSPAPTDDASRARADAVTSIAEKLLAKVHVPSGSTVIDAPTTGPLRGPAGWPGSDNLIDVSQVWKASGSMESVLAYLQAHAPSGLALSGTATGGSDAMATLDYTGAAAGPLDQGAELLITEAPDPAGGVDIRADAQDIWRPVRTAAENVPASVAGATIALTTDQTTKTLNVNAATAQQLAQLLNALPTEANFVTKGPMPTTFKTVTFTVDGVPVVFKSNDELTVISVIAGDRDQPMLADAAPVLTYVDALFGVVESPAPVSTAAAPSLPPSS